MSSIWLRIRDHIQDIPIENISICDRSIHMSVYIYGMLSMRDDTEYYSLIYDSISNVYTVTIYHHRYKSLLNRLLLYIVEHIASIIWDIVGYSIDIDSIQSIWIEGYTLYMRIPSSIGRSIPIFSDVLFYTNHNIDTYTITIHEHNAYKDILEALRNHIYNYGIMSI